MSAAIEPFLAALQRTLNILSGPIMTMGAVELCDFATITADVSARIAMLGDRKFSLILTATEAAAGELVRHVAGTEATLEDGLTADTVGEVLNVVVGTAQKGGRFQFSMPVVEAARAHRVTVAGGRCFERVISRTPLGEIGLYLVAAPDDAAAA